MGIKARAQDSSGARFNVVEITPDMAQKWLATMAPNRNPAVGRIRQYAEEMREGRWDLNGESIKLTSDGVVFDGQHRLMAIVESGVTVKSAVFFGDKPSTLFTVDVGRARHFSDILHMSGEANATALASGINYLWHWNNYKHFGKKGGRDERATHTELLDLFRKNEGIRDAVSKVSSGGGSGNHRLFSRGLGIALYHIFAAIDPTDADEFFVQVNKGANLSENSPLFRLRSRLLDHINGSMRLTPNEMAALIIKAWNLWRKGDSCAQLSWRGGGASPEAFPSPK